MKRWGAPGPLVPKQESQQADRRKTGQFGNIVSFVRRHDTHDIWCVQAGYYFRIDEFFFFCDFLREYSYSKQNLRNKQMHICKTKQKQNVSSYPGVQGFSSTRHSPWPFPTTRCFDPAATSRRAFGSGPLGSARPSVRPRGDRRGSGWWDKNALAPPGPRGLGCR